MKTPIIRSNQLQEFLGCVLVYGHFTTIHPGHIRFLRFAKKKGKKLLVALVDDIKDELNIQKYQFTQDERAEALSLISVADGIFPLNGNALQDLAKIVKPEIFLLGKEFENNIELEIKSTLDYLYSIGTSVEYQAGDIHYATTELLSSNEQDIYFLRKKQFKDACFRQKIDFENLLKIIYKWSTSKLTVVGDSIIDQYAACEALGMSAEAPVVVVRELESKNFLGGASVVASHIRSLGVKCDLISVVGSDNEMEIIKNGLEELDIGNFLVSDPSRPTTFKKRYVVENQKLFRVSKLENKNVSKLIEEKIILNLWESSKDSHGIVVSDFVYGVITEKVLEELKIISRERNIPIFGDIQCSSQVGSVTKFKEFSLLTPNEREARIALRDKESGLEKLSQELIRQTSCEKLIMKLGAEGFIVYDKDLSGRIISQPFPAMSVNPLDVSGAGDSLLAVMAVGLSSGNDIMSVASIACFMTAIAVETMGNTPINQTKLISRIEGFI